MKNRSLLIPILTVFGSLTGIYSQAVNASTSIIKCQGEVPNRTACLISPSSYKIDTYRVDICQKTPFPSYRSSADYSGANCITLFNGNGDLYKGNFSRNTNFKIPTTGRQNIKTGKYRYLTMVLNNEFYISGRYTSGETTWRTAGRDKKGRAQITTTQGEPVEIKEKLSSWRGKNNQPNDYCDNNGGTFSRCEMLYNGYKLTGIGLRDNFTESDSNKVAYVFYMVELASPINLKEDSVGDFKLRIKRSLEVYGNGRTVKSISTAPFIFEATYTNN
tara:strand:- start:907 stop:1731 length:825 start_codon:yes stop_codon:yes gene_type:complete